MVATSSCILSNSYHPLPLLDQDNSGLDVFSYRATWALMVISSIFFTLGSLAFVRALHDDPPIKPLFTWYHLQSDELLASWLFLFATIPFVPYCMIYLGQQENKTLYLLSVAVSVLMVLGTYLFVLASYPSSDKSPNQIILKISSFFCPSLRSERSPTPCCCCISDLKPHIINDWLAGAWIIFFGTLISFVASVFFLFYFVDKHSNLSIFIYASAFFQNLFFLLGSAYFVSGSYGMVSSSDG